MGYENEGPLLARFFFSFCFFSIRTYAKLYFHVVNDEAVKTLGNPGKKREREKDRDRDRLLFSPCYKGGVRFTTCFNEADH